MKSDEIERKFLVKIMPDLSGITPEEQERYFLELGETEKRITRIDNKYIYEEKSRENGLTADKNTGVITKAKFEELKIKAITGLKRTNYILTDKISIKIYDGEFKGLIRVEFEFESEEEAKNYTFPDWTGNEITNTDLGRDGRLIRLSRNEFLDLLNKF